MQCIIKKSIPLNEKMELSFNFDNCIIETVNKCTTSNKESEYGYLTISIILELKTYESLTDTSAFTRPKFLNILGIISFLTDEPFDVFSLGSQSSKVMETLLTSGISEKFIYQNTDKSKFLTEFINVLNTSKNHEKELIFSLLDRWRKARYLENESEDNFLYDDESTLSYFHVLELLGDIYSKQLKNNANNLIDNFTKQYNSDIVSLANTTLHSKSLEISKLLKNILHKEISFNSKISYLLKELKLYNIETSVWIKNLIDARNSVAHGRRVYYDKAIYPVKPFYPLITNELYPLHFLRIFISKVICSYLKISLHDKQWKEIKKSLITDEFTIKNFIVNDKYIPINKLSKIEEKIIFGGLNYFIISNKIKVQDAIKFYKFYLETEIKNKDFLASNIESIVLLYEADIIDINKKLKKAIINTNKFDCHSYPRFRDMMYYLDYHKFKTPKLETLIIKNKIR